MVQSPRSRPMDWAASEAVRGMKVEKDSDLAQIWDALARCFGFLDEPERAMRRFNVKKQQEGESVAVFEQSLRVLCREAWPKTDVTSSDADSLLRFRRSVDGVSDLNCKSTCAFMRQVITLLALFRKPVTLLMPVNFQGCPRNLLFAEHHPVLIIRQSLMGLKKWSRRLCTTEAVRRKSMLAKSRIQMQNKLLKIKSPQPDRVLLLPVKILL